MKWIILSVQLCSENHHIFQIQQRDLRQSFNPLKQGSVMGRQAVVQDASKPQLHLVISPSPIFLKKQTNIEL